MCNRLHLKDKLLVKAIYEARKMTGIQLAILFFIVIVSLGISAILMLIAIILEEVFEYLIIKFIESESKNE